MAIVSNPLIGKTSGSIGGVTFSSWKGINVAKSKPTLITNPNTDLQKAHRSAMSYLVSRYRDFSSILIIGFRELSVKSSPYNSFISYNLKNAIDFSDPPNATLKLPNFKISKGNIPPAKFASIIARISKGTITIVFYRYPEFPGQSPKDKPITVVYNESKNVWTHGICPQTRSNGIASIPLPSGWEDDDIIHTYLGFINEAGTKASESLYKKDSVSI